VGIREYLNKHYFYFGLSIVASRGMELALMFFAAKYLAKPVYGQLEYYKKVLEVGGILLSFGFPAMILTYTRSKASKVYLLLFSSLFVLAFSLLWLPFLIRWNALDLWPALLFYALFFRGGVYPLYVLVKKGSDAASLYKATVSFVFYTLVWLYIVRSHDPSKAFVRAGSVLVIPGFLLLVREWWRFGISRMHVGRYFRLFFKLVYGSLTLVVNNFVNLMFLYTDIFIIKWLSVDPAREIADYSFALNAANVLILIPATLVQVDIERLKAEKGYERALHRKIAVWLIVMSAVLIPAYFYATSRWFPAYAPTTGIFLVILGAKFFQSLGVVYGTGILIQKRYAVNLLINTLALLFNIGASITLYRLLGLYGLAWASLAAIGLRYFLLRRFHFRLTRRGNL